MEDSGKYSTLFAKKNVMSDIKKRERAEKEWKRQNKKRKRGEKKGVKRERMEKG